MCASYGLETSVADLHVEFGVTDERGSDAALQEWLDTWGTHAVKPTGSRARNLNPIVRERERDDRTVRTIDLAWWKLWVGGAPAKFPAINARAEGILDSGAWRRPFERRRVLVPATEYHEKGHRFALDGGLFAFAGLSAVAREPSGDWMVSYAIVTRPAVAHIAAIHDRMPLILPRGLWDAWLDPRRAGDRDLLDEAVAASAPVGERLQVTAV